MNAAQLFIRCLENEGVEYVFGIPGEENLDLMDALLDSHIEFITVRHEQGAAFMADVYGRLTGRPGVCMATLGPGATNLLTGVADANMDHAPVVAIAGQAATTRLHKESHQVLDLVRLFEPVSKYSTRVLEPEIVPEVVRKAFKLAVTEKPGASFIEFPENVAEMETDEAPLPVHNPPVPEPPEEQILAAAALISRSQNPMILAGHGVVRTQAHQALADFARDLRIPVANTFMAKGVVPFKHPMALGSAGLQKNDFENFGFDQADLIIAVGFDLVEWHPYLWNPGRECRIVHIHASPAEVDASYNVDVSVLGDIRYSLQRIATRVAARAVDPARPMREFLIEQMQRFSTDLSMPMKPQKIVWDLRTAMHLEDIAISDVGAHKMWMARTFRAEFPNTCIISNGFAAMGIALPGAIAACLARPQQRAVAVTGDAGFLMNVQELETAARLKLSLVVLIWNDGGYGLIEWKQMNQFGRPSHVHFGNPDFVQLAESFGAHGYRIERAEQLQAVLAQALGEPGVSVIDCPVDYRENAWLTQRLGEVVG